jgi:excisionase family DNA binding protein
MDEYAERSYRNFFTDYPDVVSVEDLSHMLGICKVNAYRLIKDGSIKSLKIGGLYRIPKRAIFMYVESAA